MFKVNSQEVFGKLKCPFLNDSCPFGVRSCIFTHDPTTFKKHVTDSRIHPPSLSYWKNLHSRMRTEQTAIKSSILSDETKETSNTSTVPLDIKPFIKAAPHGYKISFSLREKMVLRLVRELRAAGRSDASIADAAGIEHAILMKSGGKISSVYLSVAAEKIKNLATEPETDKHKEDLITEATLLSLLATRKQLNEFEFPTEAIDECTQLVGVALESEKACRRCGGSFIPSTQDSTAICRFHPERTEKSAGMRVHSCCQGGTGTVGCTTASFHVFEGYKRGLCTKFARLNDSNGGAFAVALDAEMFYTQGGYEVSRVTVVDFFAESVLLDCLVQPRFGPVLDYNTRFSGITPEMYEQGRNEILTFNEMQRKLGQIVTADTIIIGHSLDNDLRVLEFFHDRIIDTALIYPHPSGPPSRNSLKALALGHLSSFIQNSMQGHDSREDCLACIGLVKLYMYKNANLREL